MCSPVVVDKKELFRDRQLTPYILEIIPGYSGFLYYMGARHTIYLINNPFRSDKRIEPNINGLMIRENEMISAFDRAAAPFRNKQSIYTLDLYSSCNVLPVCEGIVAESVLYAIEKLNPTFDGLQMRLETYMESVSQFEQSTILSNFRKLPQDCPSCLVLTKLASLFNLVNVEIILAMSKDRISTIYKNCISGLNVSAKMAFGLCLADPTLILFEPTTWTDALMSFSGWMNEEAAVQRPFILYLKGFLAATTWQHLPDIYADCLIPDFSSEVRISLEEKEAFFREYINSRSAIYRKLLEEEPDRIDPVSEKECLQYVYNAELLSCEQYRQEEDPAIMKYLEPYCRAFFAFFERDYKVTKCKGHSLHYTGGTPSFVVVADKCETILNLLQSYMTGKTMPKEIMMPVRAAMDAGVITKPKQKEFSKVFPGFCPSNRSSFNDYIKVDLVGKQHPYYNVQAFMDMVESFKAL